ncbi:MAG: hypothetical protein ACKVP0_27210 [Pirellulaceae bacterium]
MAETLPRASLLRWGVRLGTWAVMFLCCLVLHFGLSWAQSMISPAARKKEAIAVYTAQRPKQRVLGGIALARPYGWFFKVAGPDELVAAHKEGLETFLKSVKFGPRADADPTWTLPEGWKQLEGNDLRFATIQMGSSDAPLELTVTRLPMRGGDEEEYLLANVNRWRGELGLRPIAIADLAKETTKLKGGPADMILVDMFAYLDGMPGHPDVYTRTMEELEEIARMRGEEVSQPEVKFTLPEGWKETPPGQFQISRFVVGDPKDPVEISISSAGGELVANLNRWRGQVGLEPVSETELTSALNPSEVFGLKAGQIEIVGPPGEKQQAIIGVIAPSGKTNWFIKLKGPVKPALEQKKNFEAFVKSLKMD